MASDFNFQHFPEETGALSIMIDYLDLSYIKIEFDPGATLNSGHVQGHVMQNSSAPGRPISASGKAFHNMSMKILIFLNFHIGPMHRGDAPRFCFAWGPPTFEHSGGNTVFFI